MTWSGCTTRHGACWRDDRGDVILSCWSPTPTRAAWRWIVTAPSHATVAIGTEDTLVHAQVAAERAATKLDLLCQVCGQPCPSSESHLCERCERIARAS